MWGIMVEILQIVFDPFIISAIIYGFAVIAGCTNLYKWRGLRIGLFGFIYMALSSWASGISFLSADGVLFVFLVFCWTLPFAWVRGHALSPEDKDFSRMKSEYTFGMAFTSLVMTLPRFGKWGQTADSIIVPLFILFTIVSVGSYLWYFSKYHNVFQSGDMIPVLLTNPKEASAFILDEVGILRFFMCLATCILLVGGFSAYYLGLSINYSKGGSFYGAFIWGLLCFVVSLKYVMSSYPIKHLKEARRSILAMKKISKVHGDNIKKLDVHLEDGHPRTTVLIIGESANRNHMRAFNEGYFADTTPWETEMKKDSHFYFLDKAYACFSQTAQVLSYMLTGMNQYNHQGPSYMVSLVDAAKAAGMDTWWISNQGANDTLTVSIAEEANHQLWTVARQGDDSQILDLLSAIPDKGNHFIVVHLMGSHIRYKDRVPKEYVKEIGSKLDKPLGDYDMSIMYTDYILHGIYDFLMKRIHPDSIMYVSDHGEDMKYTHGTGHFTFDMVRIPCWIYASSELKKKRPELDKHLRGNSLGVFTNDLVFDTVSGLMGVRTSAYSPQYDLSSASYDLPVKDSCTMHGKVKLESDM